MHDARVTALHKDKANTMHNIIKQVRAYHTHYVRTGSSTLAVDYTGDTWIASEMVISYARSNGWSVVAPIDPHAACLLLTGLLIDNHTLNRGIMLNHSACPYAFNFTWLYAICVDDCIWHVVKKALIDISENEREIFDHMHGLAMCEKSGLKDSNG